MPTKKAKLKDSLSEYLTERGRNNTKLISRTFASQFPLFGFGKLGYIL
jgi:hypothetical protein